MNSRSDDPVGDAAFEQAMLERFPKPEPVSIALRVAGLAIVFGLLWHAIHARGARAGALLLPLAAEVVTGMLIGVVLAVFVVREKKFRAEARRAVVFWSVVLALFALWTWYRADNGGVSFAGVLRTGWADAVDYVRTQGMHWPMLVAALGLVAATAGDVAAYRRNGPPFVYLGSLSLGLRLFVLIFVGMGFLATVDWSRRQRAELMWLVLLAAELLAMWLPWVVQKKIAQEHARRAERKAKR
jgi:hypothetical protein